MASTSELLILLTAKDHASKEFDKVADKYKAVGEKMRTIGVGMTAAITAPFVLFAKNAISGASDTEESMNKVREVFGDTAADIEAFAKGAATNLGTSRQAALEAAGTFGNLFKGMGLSKTATRDMSKDVLQLAADLGSFNNVGIEEVLANLRSGLVGEAEPMRKFGVLINEAAVKAEAMALGLGNVKGELTEQEKVQARFSLIMKGTTSAQGDFARTADGLANSQKTAAGTMKDLTDEMGTMLLPLAKEATKFLRGLMDAFTSLSPEVRKGILIFVGLAAVLGPLLIIFGTLLTLLPLIGAGMALLLGPVGLLIAAVALLALAWSQNWGDIQGKTAAAISFLQDVFDGLRLFVLNVWKGIVTGIAGAVNGIIEKINGFIGIYNAMADRLGLPIISTIALITPNLTAVDAAINQIVRDRFARVIITSVIGAGGNTITANAAGTDHITRGPELLLAGEAGPEHVRITPLGRDRHGLGGGGGGTTINVNVATVYNMSDFRAEVTSAVRDAVARGGLRGVPR